MAEQISISAGQTAYVTLSSADYSGGPPSTPAALQITITSLATQAPVVGPTSAGIVAISTGTYVYPWTTTDATPATTYVAVFSGLDELGAPVESTATVITVGAAETTSTAYAIGATSLQQSVPYLSLDMVKYWQNLGANTRNLVPQGSVSDNDAALAQYIRDATDWVNGICQQTLNATLDTVGPVQCYVNGDGYAVIHPRYRPVLALVAFSLGSVPGQLSAYSSLAGVAVERERFSVPLGPVTPLNSSQGPIQFGPAVVAPQDGAWTQYSYVNGYPVTFLTAALAAGAVEIPVADTTGIIAGRTWMTLYAGRNQHRVLVTSVSNAANGLGFGPGELGCAPLPYAVPNDDQYPTMISALPGDATRAALYTVRSFIKSNSTGSVTAATAGKRVERDPQGSGDDLAQAEAMLRKGGYVVPEI